MELFKILGRIALEGADETNRNIDNMTSHAENSQSRITSAFKKIGTAVVTYFAVDKIKVFLFNNSGNADPTVNSVYYVSFRKGTEPSVYYVKSGTSTHDIYIKKTEPYDHIYILDYQKADGIEGLNYTLTWTNELVTTLPTGYVKLSNAIGTMAVKDANDYAPVGHTHSEATTNKAGFMSAADKAKLDKIGSGALLAEAASSDNGATVSVTKAEISKYSLVYMSASFTERETVKFCGMLPIHAIIAGAEFQKTVHSNTRVYNYSVTCTSAGVFTLKQSNSINASGSLRLKLYSV